MFARAEVIEKLANEAWRIREQAFIFGKTKVGCAVLAGDGQIFAGCNIEHRFRSHDIHAEVNAISSMVSAGHSELRIVLIAAERERFTPCGGCMDWIMQFGTDGTVIAFQSEVGGNIVEFTAKELMPYYPF